MKQLVGVILCVSILCTLTGCRKYVVEQTVHVYPDDSPISRKVVTTTIEGTFTVASSCSCGIDYPYEVRVSQEIRNESVLDTLRNQKALAVAEQKLLQSSFIAKGK